MSHAVAQAPRLYGLMAQFDEAEQLLNAARRTREAGYTKFEAYSPYAIEHLADEIGNRDDRVPWIVFSCGMLGALGGFGLQVYATVIDYPMNIGGRPDLSWPSYIPITFECGVLAASLGGVVGMLMLNGLPKPYHPVFNAPGFDGATRDKFFICIESEDPKFSESETAAFLKGLGAGSVNEVKP